MTELMGRLVERISAMPDDEQERVVEWMLAELDAEQRWDQSFAAGIEVLERMADQAVADHRAGRSVPLDPDEL